jgi:ubiquinone biosynthesis protein
MQIQPQLILLQKTLLNVEGLGRELYPELDVWKTATPILREWMRERGSLRALAKELRAHAPLLLDAARSMPALLLAWVRRAQVLAAAPAAAPAPAADSAPPPEPCRAAHRHDALILGAAVLSGALVWLAVGRSPQWVGWGLLTVALLKIAYGLWR